MTPLKSKAPLVLLILDGWGVDAPHPYNAITQAHTPQWDAWWQTCPHALLEASGEAVGLPAGQIGNSEVGHLHLGAGRLIANDLTRINQAIQQDNLSSNQVLRTLIHAPQGALHVMGLLSSGGVHSHEAHLVAFIMLCAKQAAARPIYLHLFLDGRDTAPQSALASLARLQAVLAQYPGVGVIASLCGRYYAMDRDQRWERTEKVYHLLTAGKGETRFSEAKMAIQAYYQAGISDEFMPPTRLGAFVPIRSGDRLFCFNYRSDRMRQLIRAFVAVDFPFFEREKSVSLASVVTMTQYAKDLPVMIAFPPIPLHNTLGEVLSKSGLTQLRLAETEKYAHVTYFLNGGLETSYPGEDRKLIPSPKVATYDLCPAMSAVPLTDYLVEQIHAKHYNVIICNYANADMVGHTGSIVAATEAISCLDQCLKRVGEAIKAVGGALLITADHGNAEKMYDEKTQQQHTAHTLQPVPFLFVGEGFCLTSASGRLSDIAPTVLTVLGLKPTKEMTGYSLLKRI